MSVNFIRLSGSDKRVLRDKIELVKTEYLYSCIISGGYTKEYRNKYEVFMSFSVNG